MIEGRYKAYTDGGSRSNPGPAAIGGVLYDPDDEVVAEISEYIGEATNNVAEYKALIAILKTAAKEGVEELDCHLDSEFIVKQLNGEYKVKSEDMKPLFREVTEIASDFSAVRFVHVRREENEVADALVNKALDARGYKKRSPH